MTLIKLYSLNGNWALDTLITIYDQNSRITPVVMTARKALSQYGTREIAFFRGNRIYLCTVVHKEVKQ